jgi:signal peptidase I
MSHAIWVMVHGSIIRRYFEALGLALLLVFLVRGFAIQGFGIPSTSMAPTLMVGDHLLVSRLQYGVRRPWGNGWLFTYGHPRVGDVVVFVPPDERGQTVSRRREFVKRVIAVEGEVVEIRNNRVFVNGRERDSPHAYLSPISAQRNRLPANLSPRRLERGQFFVLGDNRSYSRDSREWGPIEMVDVEGKVLFVYWSWDLRAQQIRWERIGELID